jgi:hypothetical protein
MSVELAATTTGNAVRVECLRNDLLHKPQPAEVESTGVTHSGVRSNNVAIGSTNMSPRTWLRVRMEQCKSWIDIGLVAAGRVVSSAVIPLLRNTPSGYSFTTVSLISDGCCLE